METVVAPPPQPSPAPHGAPAIAPPPTPPPAAVPLLPPVLAGPAAFLWLWVLPVAVLLALNVQGYALIEGNMNEVQRSRAWWLGAANLGNLATGLALFFLTRAMAAKGAAPAAQLIVRTAPALMVQVGYLWFAMASARAIIPPDVAVWIYPPSRFSFHQFSFAMVPLFVGILHLACARPGGATARAIAVNLGLAIGAPVLLWMLGQGARAIGNGFRLPAVVMATTVVTLGVVMFVGLVRALMVGLRAARRGDLTRERAAIVVVALLLPLGGLWLNRSIDFPVTFQSWEVYALTIANAATLLLASWRHAHSPRLSFGLLCATFPFSLYFFIVFLPYTPLSVFAVLLMGAGFLILAPTLLFVLHLHLLNQARHALRRQHGQFQVGAMGVLCFCLLPASFVGRASADKVALDAALTHVYQPAITGGDITYPRGVAELRRALHSHRSYKNGLHYPLLSDFYAWWVFNNLVLSDDKLARLERTFLGEVGSQQSADARRRTRTGLFGGGSVREQTRMPRAPRVPTNQVRVTALEVGSRKAGDQGSVVSFALTLHNFGSAAGEYVKTLPLPAGIFVNGFRLHINGTPVPGRIFEKKTAIWVYTMIRDTERRDPGLLFYNSSEELELRVYPIAANASTVVEIDFLVPGAVATSGLPVDSRDAAVVLAALGQRTTPQLARDPRGTFLSAGERAREKLPVVEREPYLHVIVDRSFDRGFADDLGGALQALRLQFPAARRARITLAHHDVRDWVPELTPIEDLVRRNHGDLQRTLPLSGGLILDLALAHAIRRHRDHDLDRPGKGSAPPPRPVFVVLSRDGAERQLNLDLTEDWLDLVPAFELNEFSGSGRIKTLRATTAVATPLVRYGDSVRPLHPARAVRFAPAAGGTDLACWSPVRGDWQTVPDIVPQPGTTPWSQAVSLQLQQQDHARSPGNADLDWKGLVSASRDSGVLLAATSYIVVENSAQWRMLEHKERQKLTQNASLDFLETPAPPALYVALAFAAWLASRWWRTRASASMP